jgi:hypothetical protein
MICEQKHIIIKSDLKTQKTELMLQADDKN